jgi:hypothetical protein
MKPLCEVKTELLRVYQDTSEAYSKAVSELSRRAGSVPRVEYEKLRLATAKAREACASARDALQAHTYEHQC